MKAEEHSPADPQKRDYFRFLKRLLIFSACLGGCALVLRFTLPREYFSPALPFLFFFFMAVTLLSFYYLQRSTRERFARFVNVFLLSILLKLIVYACLLFAYAFLSRADAVPFILSFFVLYLCYTLFESAGIIGLTRRHQPGNKE